MLKSRVYRVIVLSFLVPFGMSLQLSAQGMDELKWEEHLLNNEWYIKVGLEKERIMVSAALNDGIEYKMKRLDQNPGLFFICYELINHNQIYRYGSKSLYNLDWLQGDIRYITHPVKNYVKEKMSRKGDLYSGQDFSGLWGALSIDYATEEMRMVVPQDVEWDLVIYFPNIPRNAMAGGEYYLRFVGENLLESDETYEGGHIQVEIYPDGNTLAIRPLFGEDEAIHEGALKHIMVERKR